MRKLLSQRAREAMYVMSQISSEEIPADKRRQFNDCFKMLMCLERDAKEVEGIIK